MLHVAWTCCSLRLGLYRSDEIRTHALLEFLLHLEDHETPQSAGSQLHGSRIAPPHKGAHKSRPPAIAGTEQGHLNGVEGLS